MNYTQNYQLCQWVETDRVLMDDFNADNAKIDAALGDVNGCNCRLFVKTYVGTGTGGPVVHEFPYRPMAVMLLRGDGGTWIFGARGGDCISGRASINNYLNTNVTWSDRALSIGTAEDGSYDCCNSSGSTYCMIVFLDIHDEDE